MEITHDQLKQGDILEDPIFGRIAIGAQSTHSDSRQALQLMEPRVTWLSGTQLQFRLDTPGCTVTRLERLIHRKEAPTES